jgi:hypothetical protein
MPADPPADPPAAAPTQPSSPALLEAAKVILRPLVRVLIAHGITLPAVVAALKEVFVDVARSDFRLEGKEPSDSRISLLTGVHRKDVRAIREAEHPVSTPRAGALHATVVGRWLGGADTTGPDGRPLPLPRHAPDGTPSFEALVAGVSKDVRPRTVLDELVRLGLVVHDEADDSVRLLADAFVPVPGGEEMLGFFRANLHDHMAAAGANLMARPGEPRFLERAVFYNNLAPEQVDRIEAEARTLALASLRHLNTMALEHQQAPQPGPRQRFRFGVFFWRAPAAAPTPPGPGGTP